ncbi:PREDICTED: probable sugar phosphate/phosphate translocator At5g05820 [Nicotiana attenuata]|uniref:probable sugar phosphate/phosphate translocator At5g05820 n=1 Tax=Nicotiana attenuata TaxID=49451 RepID=UPI000905579F|nr:PREDICTED: probable sugar phosphate/phosphate translocator At5g05820 [Nicotiana attenuata]
MITSGKFFTIALVAAWYSSNIGVLLLNKYLLSNYGFKYPIFLTMCHMTACSLFGYIAIAWMKIVPMQTIRSRVQFVKISALSLVFCGSVVSGNISLRYLPVSFNQAIGATTPFFYCCVCLFDDNEEGILVDLCYSPSCCRRRYYCQRDTIDLETNSKRKRGVRGLSWP